MATYRTLTVRFGGQVLMTSTISKSIYTIGLLPENDLPLADISPTHAEIRITDERAFVTDLESAQGTFVDGVRLPPHHPQAIADGTSIGIGPYDILYRSQIDQPASEAMPGLPHAMAVAAVMVAVAELPETEPEAMVSRVRSNGKANGSFAIGRYVPYLPVIYHENEFLVRFLKIFESVWEPLEQRQDHVDMYFSPRTCPASWLPWFAGWFGLELDPSLSEMRVRLLLTNAIEIYRWRGTKRGLTRVIEVCLGIHPEISEDASRPNVFRVRVQLPSDATPDFLPRLRALISAHKPAHTGYVVEVQR